VKDPAAPQRATVNGIVQIVAKAVPLVSNPLASKTAYIVALKFFIRLSLSGEMAVGVST
jgi:hypothetical protein